jgi:23S rRNA (guanine745-N1)-methyltransferase
MSSTVPASLTCIAELLRCPACFTPLASAQDSLICARRHTYDVARHGYVTLLPTARRAPTGDEASMIDARTAIMDAGHFEPLTTALRQTAGSLELRDSPVVLDAGAGTGHHLAGVLSQLPGARGVAIDVSRAASRRAARAHSRIARVRSDIWQQIPLCDATVDLAMSVFAPRNAAELARVLRPDGAVIVTTPAPDHLNELATLHAIGVDSTKALRLAQVFSGWPTADRARRVSWGLRLTRQDIARILAMGPAAHHLRPDFRVRLAAMSEPVQVTAAVEIRTFRHPTDGT